MSICRKEDRLGNGRPGRCLLSPISYVIVEDLPVSKGIPLIPMRPSKRRELAMVRFSPTCTEAVEYLDRRINLQLHQKRLIYVSRTKPTYKPYKS
jgi:hypothetical protein